MKRAKAAPISCINSELYFINDCKRTHMGACDIVTGCKMRTMYGQFDGQVEKRQIGLAGLVLSRTSRSAYVSCHLPAATSFDPCQ